MKALSDWTFTYNNFDPEDEKLRETLCTLGNGYFGTRGAAPEAFAADTHYPGTYIAGLYNKLPTMVGGKKVWNEDLVNCPNWLTLRFRIGEDKWFSPLTAKIISYSQELDIKCATLSRRIRIRDIKGRITLIQSKRIVHMGNPHLGAIKYTITPENYSDWISVRSGLDGEVVNNGVERYKELSNKHLKSGSIAFPDKNSILLSVRTNQSNVEIVEAARLRVFLDRKRIKPNFKHYIEDHKKITQTFSVFVDRKKPLAVEKTVSIHTSMDQDAQADPSRTAAKSIKTAPSFDDLLKSHKKVWNLLWKRFDIQLEGARTYQKVLRLHIFHLLQTASVHNGRIDAGFPARGLHGEAYRGHIFWDEIYALHLFDFNYPEISRALIGYRYKRLGKAIQYARTHGQRGAMFPWQSGSTGVEETQVVHLNPLSGRWIPDYSCLQRHVSFAIAYNVWKHYSRTQDSDFLVCQGAEMLLLIARFAASLVKYSTRDKRFHTEGIMGPDEFHEKMPGAKKGGLKDNAYSNFMIVWTLLRAMETLELMPEFSRKLITHKLGITEKELAQWEAITRRMNLDISPDGVISQFARYFELKELDWERYTKKYKNIQRMDRILKAENKSPDSYKVAKQADVLMIFYLFQESEVKTIFDRLGYDYDEQMMAKNYDYYVRRTSHGSTLSKVVHCFIANQLGRGREAWRWYVEVLNSDIHDTQGGTTQEGIHCGVMGGSIDIVVRSFAGIAVLSDRILIHPKLPSKIKKMKFSMLIHGQLFHFAFTRDSVQIQIRGSKRQRRFHLPFFINDREHYIKPGTVHKFKFK